MSEQRKPVLTGGCQCGAVRYALYTPPDRAGICHCRMCQKAVGGPPATFRSSSAAERGFCARCGTPLYFAYVKRPGSISMTIGSLDTPGAVEPRQVDGVES